jgi:uncharacterized protein YciI
MSKLFAVIRTFGPAWHSSHPIEAQKEWAAHASFMNNLEKEGFIVLGGPLENSPDVLLIVRAATPQEILARFALDPWTRLDLLRVTRISPWNLRFGSLP